MEKSHSYSTTAHWTMHKRGILEAEEIPHTINFAAPPEFGGEPGLWTPEHLLLGSVATCYIATFRTVAEFSRLEFSSLAVLVQGVVGKEEGGFRFTRIALQPTITIDKESDRQRAQRLLEKAERVCLIARSLDCEISLDAKIEIEEPVVAE
jgi:peroxiredoxin-like protein